ncbi:cupin domain-containing protein [Halomicrobium katesii]|uniref:cupin domain-containing protein n=1 Tax=Halomicrobium katesii TaxID=437163 RepID=UPI000371CCE1|nr:cupin domain-containing protein [Halomicrobium katesii]
MAYHQIDPDEIDATPDYPCDRRAVSDRVDTSLLHLARYTMAPGEQLPRVYHAHRQREEAFVVLSGTLHVETPDEAFVVPEGEVFVAEPESPHRAYNPADADGDVTVMGTGAPKTDPAIPYDDAE